MALIKFNRDLLPTVNNWMDDFFGRDMLDLPTSGFGYTTPKVNIREDNDNYYVEVAAPGMKKDDFNLSLENNVLTISSELKEDHEDKNDSYTRREFSYQSFSRSFTLPESVNYEKIEAKYNDGILSILMPKREEAKQKPAKSIKIS
jgi:HSP20 family protein